MQIKIYQVLSAHLLAVAEGMDQGNCDVGGQSGFKFVLERIQLEGREGRRSVPTETFRLELLGRHSF